MYGVNTGFGALVDTPVGEADLTALQGAIVRSHAAAHRRAAGRRRPCARCSCCGPGRWRPATRGCGPSCPRRLLELLALDLLPVIPGKGSVGASGDLAQLAHLAQPLIGEGRLRVARRPARPGARPPRCCASTASSR